MLIYYKSLSLEQGFELSQTPKHSRIVAGREVSTCSGYELFKNIKGPIKCWSCGCVADQWISMKHPADNSRPVLNLYATIYRQKSKRNKVGFEQIVNKVGFEQIVMMTRDHIIPKSLGGVDLIANLRPGCEICNLLRGNKVKAADKVFMQKNPHLIDPVRVAKGLEAKARKDALKLISLEIANG